MDEAGDQTNGERQPVRYVHQPPPLWPPPKWVWAMVIVLVAILGLVALRLWIALR